MRAEACQSIGRYLSASSSAQTKRIRLVAFAALSIAPHHGKLADMPSDPAQAKR